MGVIRAAAAAIVATSLLLMSCHAQEYSFRTFLAADGLGNLSVQKIYQDRDGFLWVNTENGTFRFDGERFHEMGPDQGIPRISGAAFGEAPDGSLLVGGSVGVYRFKDALFEKLSTPFKTVSWTQGIASDGRGHTFLGTEEGLFEMDAQPAHAGYEFKRVYPAEGAPAQPVYGILVDRETVWFGCGVELCRMDGGTIKMLGEESGLPVVPLVAILKDRDGNLWIRARSEGIVELPAGESRFRRPDSPVPGRVITGTPSLDQEGRILLGTPNGLLINDKKGWQVVDRRDGLQGGVYAALEDREHSLWIGTGGRGLTQWRGYREWEGYTSASGLPSDNAYEILPQADGSIFVGTEGGLMLGRPRPFGFDWKIISGTNGVPVHSLQMSRSGNIWMGTTSRGVGQIDRGTGKVQWFGSDQGLTAKWAFTVRLDRDQQLWAATESGLFVAKPPYRQFSRITELPSSWFWKVAQGTDGTVWAGGADGLFAMTGNQWRHWDEKSGLSKENVTSIGPDRDGSVWIGYQHGGGIDRIHLSSQKVSIEKGLQRRGTDGLIYFLDFDTSGNLWAGTEHGVDEWDGSRWSHYDSTDGLIWDDCDLGAFASASDRSVWIGTGGGLSHFTPRDANSKSTSGVLLTELRSGNESVLGARNPSFPGPSGDLIVGFAAPSARQDSSLLFRYRLHRNNPIWTETAQRRLEFANLGPGSYEFEIQVRDGQGVWNSNSTSFAFSIRPPWYLRTWFVFVVALIPFLATMTVFRIRVIAAQKREYRLQRIVDERTRDLLRVNQELHGLTMQDALTGLANRRRFDEMLAQECSRLKRSGTVVSLLLIDVDHFKALNDSAGHQRGDEYLVRLSQELAHAARRQIDVAARIGGEEFALILPATMPAEAAHLAETLRLQIERLELSHPASPIGPVVTVSIGVATATPERFSSPEELVGAADTALYQAKREGRNRIQIAGN